MSREIIQQALDALKLVYEQADFSNGVTDPTGTMDEGKVVIGGIVSDAIAALEAELAKPEQEPLPPVDIGVDVTPEGTHVVACYNRPDAVQEMFYSQFHPLAKPEQDFKYTEYGLRGDENGKLSIGEIPRKPWVGLTDAHISLMTSTHKSLTDLCRAIEAKLKDKNA